MTANVPNENTLSPEPLTREGFAPYGDVMQVEGHSQRFSINQGFTERFHDMAELDLTQQQGRAGVSIFRSTPLPQPLKIELMERHPLASQAFYPLSGLPYLVVVAPAGELNVKNIRAFVANKDQGVNYHPGTWHHFCLALEAQSDFLVIDRIGAGNNCDEVTLAQPLLLQLN